MGSHTSSHLLVREVMDDLRRVVRALRLTARTAEKKAGVSGAQLFVLQQLHQRPATSMEELAARTATDQSSVSALVTRLESRGLASRHRSRDDRRRVEIHLTARGRALLRRVPLPAQSRLVTTLRKMPPADLQEIAGGLRALATAVGATGGRPSLFFEKEHV